MHKRASMSLDSGVLLTPLVFQVPQQSVAWSQKLPKIVYKSFQVGVHMQLTSI